MAASSPFTSSNSNHSLIDTAVRLELPPEWVIDRAEALAAATVDGFTAEIDNLPVGAHRHLRAEEFLNSLRIRSQSVSKTAAANRLRLKTPTHLPATQPDATEYLLAALPNAPHQQNPLEQVPLPDTEDISTCPGTVEVNTRDEIRASCVLRDGHNGPCRSII